MYILHLSSHPSISCVRCTFFISLLILVYLVYHAHSSSLFYSRYALVLIHSCLFTHPFTILMFLFLYLLMGQLFLFLFLLRYLFLVQIFLFPVSVTLSVSGTNIPFYCFFNSNLFLSLHQFCLFINCPTPSVSFTSMVSFTSSISRGIFQSTVSVTTSVSINYLFM